MAAIPHSTLKAPLTKEVTADGTLQQIQWPEYARYVYVTVESTSTVANYQLGSSGDELPLPAGAGVQHGFPIFASKNTNSASMDGKRSWIYVKADSGKKIYLEYSVVGGR